MLGHVLANNVLIKLYIEQEVDKKTRGGIIIPQGLDEETQKKMHLYKEHPLQGDVLQIGKDVKNCAVGDRVYLNRTGTDLIEDSTFYAVVGEYDIIYVIDAADWKKKLELDEQKSKINTVMD